MFVLRTYVRQDSGNVANRYDHEVVFSYISLDA